MSEPVMPTTSFRLLHDAGACKERYRFLAKALGGIKAYGVNTPITLLQILNINGFDDALWALMACDDAETFSRLLACDYAEHVLHIFEAKYPDDDKPRKAIEVSRRYARGEATDAELSAAWNAAGDVGAAWNAAEAARDAAWNAAEAARDAAWYAARSAARAAAWTAAETAAWADAWIAARAAARADAGDAERQWQEARLRELLEGGKSDV